MAAPTASDETPQVPEDAALLGRIANGDQAAFRELAGRHVRYLFGVARSLTDSDAEDAEDLVQETLLAALGAAKKFRGEASVRTWLVSILVRQAAGLRRKQWRWREAVIRLPHVARDADGGPGGGGESLGQMTAPSPAAASDAKMDLAAMLEALSLEHRQVIVLRELEGMTYEQMARVLGVPRGTVESRLFRAREELRKRFNNSYQA